MKLLYKLERKFGKYAIPDLMKYLVALYAVGLMIGTFTPNVYDVYLRLDFRLIGKGEIWRLVTFLIPNISTNGLLFTIIFVYFYYLIGSSLENAWGSFRLNLYIFSGILLNIIAAWLMYLVFHINGSPSMEAVYNSMFFAYAAIYPNSEFYMYFLIPLKAKYLAWIDAIWIIYSNIVYLMAGEYFLVIITLVSLANFLIFFFATRNYKKISPREFERKARFRREVKQGKKQFQAQRMQANDGLPRHRCTICGRTELDDDQLEFRFCSKCDGNYEYCMEHLFSHEHVKK